MVPTMFGFGFRSFIRDEQLTEMQKGPGERSKIGAGRPSTHSKRLKAKRKQGRR